ncbi:acyl-CoA thioesterase [Mucilaginibacter phyllosphaerae]|uniref:Acyl-CoA thioester hydrolase n=1 Tax=Mucilaginibacter phyllosphaerae TaxID=1812349 RepID=A0A4Y8A8Y5_9SPHI|nr:thioesterase family protein [Mucilaginibacter phyllosphaerae]MBB3970764.1 acyl-CoA thioester hydrolase [Mucilaginibacter phyllosphaerae]TEW64294.1 acyl-CoA thioesterase [Mucilaginibacter phyllosphaerae]GGH04457.1 thioesterase [Mucilaginibacter phyllosphaerae]
MTEKLTDYKYQTDIIIRFSDIDARGHVNNAVYLTYFEVARFNYWRDVARWNLKEIGIVIGRSEINYLKPVTIDDVLVCYVRVIRIGNSSFDVMHVLTKVTDKGHEICTTCKTTCISYDYTSNRSVPIPKEGRQNMIDYDEPRLILNTN